MLVKQNIKTTTVGSRNIGQSSQSHVIIVTDSIHTGGCVSSRSGRFSTCSYTNSTCQHELVTGKALLILPNRLLCFGSFILSIIIPMSICQLSLCLTASPSTDKILEYIQSNKIILLSKLYRLYCHHLPVVRIRDMSHDQRHQLILQICVKL